MVGTYLELLIYDQDQYDFDRLFYALISKQKTFHGPILIPNLVHVPFLLFLIFS